MSDTLAERYLDDAGVPRVNEHGIEYTFEQRVIWLCGAYATSHSSSAAAVLGAMTSDKKAASSRENGKRGGRPRKSQ